VRCIAPRRVVTYQRPARVRLEGQPVTQLSTARPREALRPTVGGERKCLSF
jgi:hypothetical protein